MFPEKRPLNPDGELPAELQALEAALATLAPRADRLDRDRLVFEAGRQSVLRVRERRRWAWPALSAALGAVAASLLALLVLPSSSPRPLAGEGRGVREERNDPLPSPSPTAPGPSVAISPGTVAAATARRDSTELPYLELRDRVLAHGLDAWKTPALGLSAARPVPSPPPTYAQLRDQFFAPPPSRASIQ